MRQGGEYNNLTVFTAKELISPANLELIGNISGCESHRREADCQVMAPFSFGFQNESKVFTTSKSKFLYIVIEIQTIA